MSQWPKKSLLEICRPKQWPTISADQLTETGFPVYGANGRIGFFHSYNHKEPTLLITCRGATCGTLNICEPMSYVTGNAMALDDIDLSVAGMRFLYYALLSRGLDDAITGAAQPQITRANLRGISVPIPPLAEQERIVALLDESDELRMLRAQADRRTANLIPALFHEMFGVPLSDSVRYPIKKLSQLVRGNDRINYGVVQPGEDIIDGAPVIRVGDFGLMSINQTHLKRISYDIEKKYVRSRLIGDEILISCVGSIGHIALADRSLAGFNIVRAVARVPLCDQVDRVFVASQLMTPELQTFFRRETRTVAQPTLNIRQIQEAPIILPPLSLQQQFAQRVSEIRTMEAEQAASRQRLDDLFQSMLHRAFNDAL